MTDTNGTQIGVAVTRLKGRSPLNLLGRATFLTLKAELDRLEQDRSVRAIILTGADDRALLGRLWGVSGHDVATAQREQRRARREIEQQLRQQREALDQQAGVLLEAAPRLGR